MRCLATLSLVLITLSASVSAQEFGLLLSQGPVSYLHGPALRQLRGNLTGGDRVDIAVGDYDGDGRCDLLTGSAYGDLLFYRREDLAFDKAVLMLSSDLAFTSRRGGRLQVSPDLADFNRDGVLDLLLGAGPDIYFYSRKGGMQPGKVLRAKNDQSLGQIIRSSHLAPCAVDLDGDADVDLLLGDEEGRVWWVECLQSDPLQLAEPRLLAAGDKPLQVGPRARVCAGDWDGDSRYDLIVGDATGHLYFARGRREGLAALEPLLPDRPAAQEGDSLTDLCPRLMDVDGDKRLDLLLGCRSGLVATYGRTPQGPVFEGYLQSREAPIDVGRGAAPTATDWNGDGVGDLVVGAEDGLIRLYLGRRDGLYESGQTVVTNSGPVRAQAGARGGRYSWPRLTDLNGDGVDDLVLGGASGLVEMHLNQGGFRPAGNMRIGGVNIQSRGLSAIALADHDGDGDPDLFVGERTLPDEPVADPGYPGARFVLPAGGLAYYENESPKGRGMPVFLKGVRLAAYLGKRGRSSADDALDAGVLGLQYIEPVTLTGERWEYLIGTRLGYYLFPAAKTRDNYPTPILESSQGIPNPLFPALYSCTAATLGGTEKGLLCGLSDYGFVCYFRPDQVPQLNRKASE
ncbi:MAG: FG-GAP repeat domain-containing protein [Armatimonadota bacterium]